MICLNEKFEQIIAPKKLISKEVVIMYEKPIIEEVEDTKISEQLAIITQMG